MSPPRTARTATGKARRQSRRPARQEGFSTLEAVIVIPTLVILTMLAVQFALLYHGRNAAEAAVRDGLRVARGYESTGAAGAADCTHYLDQVAGRMLTEPTCTATRAATTVTVSVHATVMSVVPFGTFHVNETATAPVEVFVANPGGFAPADVLGGGN